MNKISLDTVKLHISDYSIATDHSLTIQPPSMVNNTGELIGDYKLINDQYGSKAYKNYDDGFSISIKPKGSYPLLFVQWSVGRITNKENYLPCNFETIKESFKTVQDRLTETGIHTNINDSSLSRSDMFRNVLTAEKPKNYFQLLTLCNMKRAEKRDYGTTVNFINSLQEISVYDKLVEMEIAKKETQGLPDTIRIEHRLLKGSKIKSFLGFNKVSDLLTADGFHHAKEKYIQALRENIFRYDTAEINLLSQKTIEHDLLTFKNSYGRMFLSAYIRAKGYENIVQHCNADIFLNAVKNVDSTKGRSRERKIQRYKREIDKMKFDLAMIESDLFASRSNSELYFELKSKALSAA